MLTFTTYERLESEFYRWAITNSQSSSANETETGVKYLQSFSNYHSRKNATSYDMSCLTLFKVESRNCKAINNVLFYFFFIFFTE